MQNYYIVHNAILKIRQQFDMYDKSSLKHLYSFDIIIYYVIYNYDPHVLNVTQV